jgi:hypothetical protein
MIINYNFSSEKYQVFLRLFFLQGLIPDSAHSEPQLSLTIDKALMAWEEPA